MKQNKTGYIFTINFRNFQFRDFGLSQFRENATAFFILCSLKMQNSKKAKK